MTGSHPARRENPAGGHELGRILRFIAVGMLNTAFSYACFLLLHWMGLPLSAAVVLSTIAGVLFNFVSFGTLVFRPARGMALLRFIVLYAVIAGFNYILLRLLSGLGAGIPVAQGICLPLLAAASYLGMRFWVFVPAASRLQGKGET